MELGLTSNKITSKPDHVVLCDPGEEREQRFDVADSGRAGWRDLLEELANRYGLLDENFCSILGAARQDRLAPRDLVQVRLILL